jgi:cytochrome c oxidase subunit 2
MTSAAMGFWGKPANAAERLIEPGESFMLCHHGMSVPCACRLRQHMRNLAKSVVGKLVVITSIMQRQAMQGLRALPAALLVASGVWLSSATAALAGTGQPTPWQKGLQNPVTEVATEINRFHDLVNIIIIAITIFVLILLAVVIFRFNERANPTPSRTTHHTGLEIAWTVVPILILVVIAIPSFKLLYLQYSYPKPDITIKAIGNAWFWEHEFPDNGGFKVTSNMVKDEDLLRQKLGETEYGNRFGKLEGTALTRRLHAEALPIYQERGLVRMLSVDNEIAVPENKVVHVLVTANDVIHNWTIPSFGSKIDAVPGRVTATWFKATQRGMYYGQCSELCGKDHAAMPIAVRVVSQANFDSWAGALRDAKDAKTPAERRQHLNRARDVMQKAALEDAKPGVRVAGSASSAK